MAFVLDNPWRKTYEIYSAAAWVLGFIYSIYIYFYYDVSIYIVAMNVMITGFFIIRNIKKSYLLFKRKANLQSYPVDFIEDDDFIEETLAHPEHARLGKGFEWGRHHAQSAADIVKADKEDLEIPYLIKKLWVQDLDEKYKKGKAWIHGLELKEDHIDIPLEFFKGHTYITGLTGSGKTRTLDSIVSGCIIRGDSIIIIDPKNDRDLRENTQRMCKKMGRRFMYLNPANPEYSCRVDPLHNWNKTTEIASRVSGLIASETGGDPFVAFSWRAINLIVQGLVFIGTKPNLMNIRLYIEGGPDELIKDVFEKHFNAVYDGWKEEVDVYINTNDNKRQQGNATVDGYINFYNEKIKEYNQEQIVDGLISMYQHSRDHQIKMIASLLPILSMLTSGDMGELLSPDHDDDTDPRPITDSKKIIQGKECLLISTDSLADGVVGGALASILLSDITAVAGDRYNYELDNSRVSVIVDEAAECIGAGGHIVQLANKSRGAGFELYLVSQVIDDFTAKTGSLPKTKQLLGNMNNIIALRTKDKDTQDFVVEEFGKCSIYTTMHDQKTSSMSSDKDITNFSSSYGERKTEDNTAALFTPELLSALPDLHYVASIAGGKIIKGRVPIITSKTPVSLNDLPWMNRGQV